MERSAIWDFLQGGEERRERGEGRERERERGRKRGKDGAKREREGGRENDGRNKGGREGGRVGGRVGGGRICKLNSIFKIIALLEMPQSHYPNFSPSHYRNSTCTLYTYTYTCT